MLKKVSIGLAVLSFMVTGFIIFQTASSLRHLATHHEEAQVEESASTVAGGGHGSAPAEGHGEAPAHGEGHSKPAADRGTASSSGTVPFVSIDEVFANVAQDNKNYTLAIKLDVEFFDEKGKQAFKTNQSAVRNLIIQTSREQEYDLLASLSGKLYFKELLIRKINEHLQGPLVKDVHFASFFLQ